MTAALVAAGVLAAAAWYVRGLVRGTKPCWLCKGKGGWRILLLWFVTCPRCKGSGLRFTVAAKLRHGKR